MPSQSERQSTAKHRVLVVLFVLCIVSLVVIMASAVVERDWFALGLTFIGVVGGFILARWLR